MMTGRSWQSGLDKLAQVESLVLNVRCGPNEICQPSLEGPRYCPNQCQLSNFLHNSTTIGDRAIVHINTSCCALAACAMQAVDAGSIKPGKFSTCCFLHFDGFHTDLLEAKVERNISYSLNLPIRSSQARHCITHPYIASVFATCSRHLCKGPRNIINMIQTRNRTGAPMPRTEKLCESTVPKAPKQPPPTIAKQQPRKAQDAKTEAVQQAANEQKHAKAIMKPATKEHQPTTEHRVKTTAESKPHSGRKRKSVDEEAEQPAKKRGATAEAKAKAAKPGATKVPRPSRKTEPPAKFQSSSPVRGADNDGLEDKLPKLPSTSSRTDPFTEYFY